ncbi:MAG: trypsin-like peptidase domain-containing protein [Nannocystaceae bacterium]
MIRGWSAEARAAGRARALWLAGLLALACRRVEDDGGTSGGVRVRAGTEVEPAQLRVAGESATIVVPDFAKVAERLAPSVVTVISEVAPSEQRQRAGVVRGVGSGLVASANGQVLTNEHVVADTHGVEVEFATGERVAAKVVYADDRLDLALLQLEGSTPALQPVAFSERGPRPGEWVMAVGQPFGLGHTVTVGVIGGLGRDHDDLGRPEGLRPDGIWSFIQTDASINVGNSGGPLVDADGSVVGITTAVRSDGQGLAFAVPASIVRRFLEDVWTHGRVRHARLGLKAENAEAGVIPGRGSVVRITAVDDAGPAANAGLVPGDVVLAIDGAPVRRVSDVAFRTLLRGVGAKLTVTIKREGALPQDVIVVPADGGR